MSLEGRPEYQIYTRSEQVLDKELQDRGIQLVNDTVEKKWSRLHTRFFEEKEYFELQ